MGEKWDLVGKNQIYFVRDKKKKKKGFLVNRNRSVL